MKVVFIVLVSLVCLPALAEEKTCAVKGMECTGCAGTVKEKVCNESYATCDVQVVDKKSHVGQIHIITKEATAKVDEGAIREALKEFDQYKVEVCVNGGPAKTKGKKKAS